MQGWRLIEGQTDEDGEFIDYRIYNQKDFDRSLVTDERTELVPQTITSYLEHTDTMAETIVFCNNIEPPRLYRRVFYLSQAAMPDRIKLS